MDKWILICCEGETTTREFYTYNDAKKAYDASVKNELDYMQETGSTNANFYYLTKLLEASV